MSLRCQEPGWERVGEWDSVKRRSLWIRTTPVEAMLADAEAIEMCSGREGDDWFCRIERSNPVFGDLMQVLTTQAWSVTT